MPRPKVAPVIVGALVPFCILDNGGRGGCFGFIAAVASTPAAKAIAERPTTTSAV